MTRTTITIAALGAAVIVLASALLWVLLAPPAAEPALPPPPAPSSVAPSFNEDAGDAAPPLEDDQATDEDPDSWQPVVESFGRDFTDTAGGSRAWRQRLIGNPSQPQVSTEVADQLASVDIANIPNGRYDTYETVSASAYEAEVKVSYREGWSMVLSLITDGTSWQIYAYDKYEE